MENLSKSLYLLKHTRKMNTTDKGSILIVCLFYVITLASGYYIHKNQLLFEKNNLKMFETFNNLIHFLIGFGAILERFWKPT